jgi:RNA polymerase sigma-70 factor (ECF subfamily)
MTDEELFALSLEKPYIFAEILERYQEAFLRKAESIIKDRDRAEDIVQDTFVKIYRRGGTFVSQGNGSFKSWSYRVLMNTAFTEYQKTNGRGSIEFSPELMEVIPDRDEEGRMANREMGDYISSVLSRMPAQFSEVLRKFFLEGKSQEEIAREGGLSSGAVKVRIHRAKESFRRVSGGVPW